MKDLFITRVPQIKGLTFQEIIKKRRSILKFSFICQTWQKKSSRIEILYEILEVVEESLLEIIVHILIPDKLRGLIEKSMLVREVKLIK